jgi:rhodanese-related sulfurtransferase
MKIKNCIPVISVLLVSILIAGCSQATIQTISTSVTTNTTTLTVPTSTVRDANDLIQQNTGNSDFAILDVRTADEFYAGHIAGAINLDYTSSQFTADVSLLDKSKEYLVYCKTGVRGAAATLIMVGLGFKNVQNITGGITTWIQDGYPTTAPITSETTITN